MKCFSLVRHVWKNEKRYYERIVAYSRERLMLFPYHLADMIVKGLRITPFNYYISVVEKLIQSEKSYDTLPNFTAADCKCYLTFIYKYPYSWNIICSLSLKWWNQLIQKYMIVLGFLLNFLSCKVWKYNFYIYIIIYQYISD